MKCQICGEKLVKPQKTVCSNRCYGKRRTILRREYKLAMFENQILEFLKTNLVMRETLGPTTPHLDMVANMLKHHKEQGIKTLLDITNIKPYEYPKKIWDVDY